MGMLVLAGIGVGAAILIPWSMLPDVIELDELRTGLRREGLYYSIFVVIQQMGIAGALAFSSYLLGVSGYVAPHDQKDGGDTQPQKVSFSSILIVALDRLLIDLLGSDFAAITCWSNSCASPHYFFGICIFLSNNKATARGDSEAARGAEISSD